MNLSRKKFGFFSLILAMVGGIMVAKNWDAIKQKLVDLKIMKP